MGINLSVEAEVHDRVSIDLLYIQHQLIDAIIALNKPTVLAHDRVSIDLPYNQHQLIDSIIALNKPIVLVLLNGGMVAIENPYYLSC